MIVLGLLAEQRCENPPEAPGYGMHSGASPVALEGPQMSDLSSLPILYSFRRCPYAIRARMALVYSGEKVRLREVVLRDKPPCMLDYSPKGTVPVLVLPNGTVIDESRAVIQWALDQADPAGWRAPDRGSHEEMEVLIDENDGPFKANLDRYKYATRYEGVDPLQHRAQGLAFLGRLNDRLSASPYLFGSRASLADIAIGPFVRQFAHADKRWFDTTPLPHLHRWLDAFLTSPLFLSVMPKVPRWEGGTPEPVFPEPTSLE